MDRNSAANSSAPSRDSTPSLAANSRFTSQNATAEDLLKSQTVGLVQLSDFRKRRAEVLEQKEREAQDRSLGRLTPGSGASTPADGAPAAQTARKKQKKVQKGKLSFGLDGDEDEEGTDGQGGGVGAGSATPKSRGSTPALGGMMGSADASDGDSDGSAVRRKLGPNSKLGFVPKAKTKNALLKEAQTREQLRKEFLVMQEAVRATEVVLPFVFYDGTNVPGGRCRIKKGDHVWLFLDKARKVGAELGLGGDKSRREWARVSVDDLMLVRHEIIIPHHYELYYFLLNRTRSFTGGRLFDWSAEPTSASPKAGLDADEGVDLSSFDPLAKPSKRSGASVGRVPDEDLEGYEDEAAATKVVDRRWYERNKHIYPASTWEEFDPAKDYGRATRKDAEGNSFFFS